MRGVVPDSEDENTVRDSVHSCVRESLSSTCSTPNCRYSQVKKRKRDSSEESPRSATGSTLRRDLFHHFANLGKTIACQATEHRDAAALPPRHLPRLRVPSLHSNQPRMRLPETRSLTCLSGHIWEALLILWVQVKSPRRAPQGQVTTSQITQKAPQGQVKSPRRHHRVKSNHPEVTPG